MTNEEVFYFTTPSMEESNIQPEFELTNIDLTEVENSITVDINND